MGCARSALRGWTFLPVGAGSFRPFFDHRHVFQRCPALEGGRTPPLQDANLGSAFEAVINFFHDEYPRAASYRGRDVGDVRLIWAWLSWPKSMARPQSRQRDGGRTDPLGCSPVLTLSLPTDSPTGLLHRTCWNCPSLAYWDRRRCAAVLSVGGVIAEAALNPLLFRSIFGPFSGQRCRNDRRGIGGQRHSLRVERIVDQ